MTQDFQKDIPDKDNEVFTDIADMDTNFLSLLNSFLGTSAPSSAEEGLFWADGTPPQRPQPKLHDGSGFNDVGYQDGWVNKNWTINNVSDGSTFEINSEVESTLFPNGIKGRMLQIVQPTNGTTYAPVESANASGGTTTVNLANTRTQDLDSGEGVDEIYHGQRRPDLNSSQPEIGYNKLAREGILTVQANINLATNDVVDLLPQNALEAERGADEVKFLEARAVITTEIAADNTTPIVEVQDGNNNEIMTIDTFADGDVIDTLRRTDDDTDGTVLETHDLTNDKIQLKTTTKAADSSSATGDAAVKVTMMPIE
jgi:hypothetical protein